MELDGTSHTAAVQGRPRDRRLDLDILGRRRGGRAAGHDEGMASIRWVAVIVFAKSVQPLYLSSGAGTGVVGRMGGRS